DLELSKRPAARHLSLRARPADADGSRRGGAAAAAEKAGENQEAAGRQSRGLAASQGASIWLRLPDARSGEVEAIEVHHLVPGRHEVFRKLLLRVGAGIDFCKRAELRVRTEDQVDAGAGPLARIRLAVAALVHAIGAGRLPLRAHVEKIDEEVVGQRLRLFGEDAVLGLPGICAENAQAADENR